MRAVQILGVLFVDMDSAPPRARYECLLCRTRAGPITGHRKVAAFVANIRTEHRATCPGHPNHQGAQAA